MRHDYTPSSSVYKTEARFANYGSPLRTRGKYSRPQMPEVAVGVGGRMGVQVEVSVQVGVCGGVRVSVGVKVGVGVDV